MFAVLAGEASNPPAVIDRVGGGREAGRRGGWLAARSPPTYTPTDTHTHTNI